MPTTSAKPQASGGATTRPMTSVANGTPASGQLSMQQALESIAQLEQTVAELKRELQASTGPGVVGRDTILLRSYFDQIVGRTMRVAQQCRITWQPTAVGAGASRGR